MNTIPMANWVQRSAFAFVASCCALAMAQPGAPNITPNSAPVQPVETPSHPGVWLTYYVGEEGNRAKEVAYVELTEWTNEKDVYLELTLNKADGTGWSPSPDTDARLAPDFKLALPPQRVWKVRYETAAKQGESRLFITGYGDRNASTRIYLDVDQIHFIFIPSYGWWGGEALARFYRFLQLRYPVEVTPAPTPTRSQ
jgi:hypothetical protein